MLIEYGQGKAQFLTHGQDPASLILQAKKEKRDPCFIAPLEAKTWNKVDQALER